LLIKAVIVPSLEVFCREKRIGGNKFLSPVAGKRETLFCWHSIMLLCYNDSKSNKEVTDEREKRYLCDLREKNRQTENLQKLRSKIL
jgi:hypothetical protein